MGLPVEHPGVLLSPTAVPPHLPQLTTPPRSLMRTALTLAATHLHSRVRVALGPSDFNSLRSLMLRQQSAYGQQLSQLHMLSQVQELLMSEAQTPAEGNGAFATQRQRQQQLYQHQRVPPSRPKVARDDGDSGLDEGNPGCTPRLPPLPSLRPSCASRPTGSPLPPLGRGVVSSLAMSPLPRGKLVSGVPADSSRELNVPGGGLKRKAWHRDREGGHAMKSGGVEGEGAGGGEDCSASQRRGRRGAKSAGYVGSPQGAALDMLPVSPAMGTSSSHAY